MAEKSSFRGIGLGNVLMTVAFSIVVTIALLYRRERLGPPASIRPAEHLIIQPIELEVRRTADVLRVEWSGVWPSGMAPDTNCIDPGFYQGGPPPVQLYDKHKELGFREDGVVVWRESICQQ